MLQSIRQFSLLTGLDRETVAKRLKDLVPQMDSEAPNAAKNYESTVALPILYGIDPGGEARQQTAIEAKRDLDVARKQKLEIEMEVLRKERIPLEDLNLINDEAYQNVSALLKANVNKPLTEELVGDMFTALREIGRKVKERAG